MRPLIALLFLCLSPFTAVLAQNQIENEIQNNQTLLKQLSIELQKQAVLGNYTEAQILKSLVQANLNNIHTLKLERSATQQPRTVIQPQQPKEKAKIHLSNAAQKTHSTAPFWPMQGQIHTLTNQPSARLITNTNPQIIRAPADGKIIFSSATELLGHLIIIRHNNHYLSLYGHINTPHVRTNQTVKAGDTIASNTSKLFFEVRRKGLKTPAQRWLQKSSKLH